MKDIMTAPFLIEMIRTTTNMYNHGWDERNGGNISVLLDEGDVSAYLDTNTVLRTIPTGFLLRSSTAKNGIRRKRIRSSSSPASDCLR